MRLSPNRKRRRILTAALYLAIYLAITQVARLYGNSEIESFAAGIVCCGFLGVFHLFAHYLFYSPDWNITRREQ